MTTRQRWQLIGAGIIALLALTLIARAQTYERAPVPGSINAAVTEANKAETICNREWERLSRPPQSYTAWLKAKLARERHVSVRDYELDHLIPLCAGGAPRDPENLWLQPWPSARLKDEEEAATCRAICEGRITLAQARKQFADEWGRR